VNDTENRKQSRNLRVQVFGEAHANDFAPTSLGKQLFAALETIIVEIQGYAASEVSGIGDAREGTSTRGQAREELRADLEAIARTARAMAADTPGLEDQFRVPRNQNDQHLLAAARAFATDAVPLKAQFIAHELPADFLEDLNADIAALEAAIANQASGRGSHVSARAAIDDAIERADEVLRKLDAIVKNKYANNPSVLAEWLSASHTERAPRRRKTATPPPPTVPGQ
jgi:hypothetical protein